MDASSAGSKKQNYIIVVDESKIKVYTVYMLGAKHGFVQSVDCPVQSMDPCFALAIHGMTHDCAILGLRTHDEREGPLLATLPAR